MPGSPAIHISNSEIGAGRIWIAIGLFRGVCANRAIVFSEESATGLVHRGGRRGMVSKVERAITKPFAFPEDLAAAFSALIASFMSTISSYSLVWTSQPFCSETVKS